MRRLVPLTLALGAALALAPAGASAAVAGLSSTDGESLVYSADPGEANRLTVSRAGDRLVFDDQGATITAGDGCESVAPTRVTCAAPSARFVSVELGDEDDVATTGGDIGDVGTTVALAGEQGSDTLRGTVDRNLIDGGAGGDFLQAGPGTESIDATLTFGGSSAEMPEVVAERDTVRCVPALDSVEFRSVQVDELDEVDGDCGVPLSVFTADAVVVRGTEGPDGLNGHFFPTKLYGLGGDDRLSGTGTPANRMDGGAGNDTIESGGLLLGGDGDDRLSSAIANDIAVRQSGGAGNDLLLGRYGNDRLVGGPGRDRISGGSGNDYLNARDGERDSVRCGDGRADRAVVDRGDSVARDCERVSRR